MQYSQLSSHWLLALGIVLLASSVIVVVANKRQRDAVLVKLLFKKRRTSGASTPPRSLSISKEPPTASSTNPDYVASFPPSRRCAFLELSEKERDMNSSLEPSADFFTKNLLPVTKCYMLDNPVPKYTPTGFSTAEIKEMGDFPAYDIISGVPLPEPYEGFDPARALPRPYRPFRWAYHQTMCK